MIRVLRGIALLLVPLVCTTGCTLDAQQEPEPITSDPQRADQQQPDSEQATTQQVVYLVRDGHLAPVDRWVVAAGGVDAVLRAVVGGPTAAEQAAGYQSALPVMRTALHARIIDGVATISVPAGLVALGASRQVMAVGQLVYSVTEIDGVDQVQLDNGGTVELPVSDGALTSAPVDRSDYAAIAPR
ncbi:GerMN domain-containing protein [Microlunatus elymi]|nr:GerMN domain-containing protein [Microlunatus elymi]